MSAARGEGLGCLENKRAVLGRGSGSLRRGLAGGDVGPAVAGRLVVVLVTAAAPASVSGLSHGPSAYMTGARALCARACGMLLASIGSWLVTTIILLSVQTNDSWAPGAAGSK